MKNNSLAGYNDKNQIVEFVLGDEELRQSENEIKQRVEDVHTKVTKWYFWVGGIISLGFAGVFLYLVARERNVPEYFIGFVGSIVGFFLAKKPWEIIRETD